MARYVVLSAAAASRVTAFLATVDELRGYPCCPCNAAEVPGCTCDQHRRPDGSPAPHAGSCALRHLEAIVHADGRIAVEVDAVIAWVRNHPDVVAKLLARGLTTTQINQLRAAIDAAGALPSNWLPAV